MRISVPVRTYSEANMRVHWGKRAARMRTQRGATRLLVTAHMGGKPRHAPPLTIWLTRIAPRRLDSDNLRGALKAVRDGVADALGIDDGDPGVEWLYAQRKGERKEYAVEVLLERGA